MFTVRFHTFIVFGFCLFVSSCSTTSDYSNNPFEDHPAFFPQQALINSLPDWAARETKRESSISKTTQVLLGNEHRLTLIGDLVEQPGWYDDGSYWHFQSTYGGEGILDCYMLKNSYAPLHELQKSHDAEKDFLLEESSTVSQTVVTRAQINSNNGIPTAALDYLYVLDANTEDAVIAHIKGNVAYSQNHVLACTNSVFGYRVTFDRIFNRLATSWQMNDDNSNPHYKEAQLSKLAKRNISIATVELSMDEADTKIVMNTSTLVQLDANNVRYSDTNRVEYSSPDGRLINAYYTELTNGKLVSRLALKSEDTPQSWQVEGEFQSKPVRYTGIKINDLNSQIGLARETRDALRNSSSKGFNTIAWMPEFGPSNFPKSSFQVNRRKSDNHKTTTRVGDLTMHSTLDNTASSVESSMITNNQKVTVKRINVSGTFE